MHNVLLRSGSLLLWKHDDIDGSRSACIVRIQLPEGTKIPYLSRLLLSCQVDPSLHSTCIVSRMAYLLYNSEYLICVLSLGISNHILSPASQNHVNPSNLSWNFPASRKRSFEMSDFRHALYTFLPTPCARLTNFLHPRYKPQFKSVPKT